MKTQPPPEPRACKDLVEVSDRVSCGWGGITQKECEDRECCFDSSIRDVPWCFSIPEPPEPKTEMKTQPPPEVTTIPTTLACELPSGLKNVAVGKEADQSSINKGAGADRAVDGNKNSDLKKGKSCMWTKKEFEPWWKVDLGQEYSIYEVVITNRQDCCPFRIKNAVVRVGSNANVENNPVCGHQVLGKRSRQETITVQCGCETPMRGRYVSIKLADKTQVLHVCEVEVMAL
ncbi:fucolectin-1-like isoform X2 [Ptychodera flava]|uniref:fucolectin-1-like isoform X2 n=1 Tax=Ptychodera flava TaxID=63121 RepID=UPI00396A6EE1